MGFLILLFGTTAESFQFLAVVLHLTIFLQDFQLDFQILDLRFQVVQLGEKSTAVSISGDRCIAYLLRLNSIFSYNVLGDTCHLHIATVDSVLNKLVLRLSTSVLVKDV